MFAGFLVVFFVEATHQFFEDRAHAVIVQAGLADFAVGVLDWVWTEVDVG